MCIRPSGSVVPFARRWHVIQELDLMSLVAGHAALACLCDRLEACADALPALPEPAIVDDLCRELGEVAVRHADRGEPIEDLLRASTTDRLPAALLRLMREHRSANAVYAVDLIAALRSEPVSRPASSVEALGYMLRCFFVGCRAAIEFEQLAILTIAQHRLTRDGRELLVETLSRRDG